MGLEEIGDWEEAELGPARQEIVMIGIEMNRAELNDELNACLLNEEEMAQGKYVWFEWEDPFPLMEMSI